MSSGIPTSTSIVESAVIAAPLSKVWHLIKLQDFSKWWSIVESVDAAKGTSDETDVYKVKFKDGTVVDFKQEEHSSIHHYITYSLIASSETLPFSSVYSTIRVFPITSGKHENETYVEWSATFSGDADASTVQDARYKRKEGLQDLAKAVASA